jgi:tetratricopeptide (TPR) repeat protein
LSDDSRQLVGLGAHELIDYLCTVGQLERARELAAKQIADAPDRPESFLAMARVLIVMRELDAAIAAARQAVTIAPDWSNAWGVHSAALFNAGRFAEAETSIREAIRLAPDRAIYFLRYARILKFCGKSEPALELATKAVELDPDDQDAHQLVAQLLLEVGPSKWHLSEEAARRAIALDPEDDDGYAILGGIQLSQHRYDEAEESYRTALTLNAHNTMALNGLAHVVMGRNWLYGPFLWYALVMSRAGVATRLLVVAGLWAFVSLLRATLFHAEPGNSIVSVVYLALCAYTWFAEPVTRAILRRRYRWL